MDVSQTAVRSPCDAHLYRRWRLAGSSSQQPLALNQDLRFVVHRLIGHLKILINLGRREPRPTVPPGKRVRHASLCVLDLYGYQNILPIFKFNESILIKLNKGNFDDRFKNLRQLNFLF